MALPLRWTALVASAFAVARDSPTPAPAPAARKNLLFMMADDMRAELGFLGDTHVSSPNLDALATSEHSALFHRFYSGAGVCSPTRGTRLARARPPCRCSRHAPEDPMVLGVIHPSVHGMPVPSAQCPLPSAHCPAGTILTGRTNERFCVRSALPCDQEDPAPTCSQGKAGCLPPPEFTIAKAAKKSKLGDYATVQLGKWHLGDLWDKKLPHMNPHWIVASPGTRSCLPGALHPQLDMLEEASASVVIQSSKPLGMA
eukprot:gene5713-5654_t